MTPTLIAQARESASVEAWTAWLADTPMTWWRA